MAPLCLMSHRRAFSLAQPADGEDSTVSIQIKLENEGSDEELETDMLYSPQLALKLALTEWLGEFCVPRQYNGEIESHLTFSRQHALDFYQ